MSQLQLTNLPATKTAAIEAVQPLIQAFEDGNIYATELLARAKQMEIIAGELKAAASPHINNGDAWQGVKFAVSSKANKDYSNDIYWNQLKAEKDAIDAKMKEHQKLIDSVQSVATQVEFTTPEGEVYKLKPATITYTPVVTVTIPK